MPQPQTTRPPPCDPATIPLVATHHSPPVDFPRQWDRITAYPSRFWLRTIATIVVDRNTAPALAAAWSSSPSAIKD